MSFEPVEGVDYIFDRYAYLGLSVGVTKEEVKAAIKKKRVQVHTDKLNTDQKDILAQATAIREKVDQCAHILLNDDLCPYYDAKLKEFLDTKPERVSKDGTPIIFLGDELFSLDDILSDDIPNTSELEKRIAEMTQFSDAKFGQMETLYKAMSGNDQVRSLYRDALTQKLVYLELLEDAAWMKIGFANKKDKASGLVLHADKYLEHVEAEIAKVTDKTVGEAVENRNKALQIGTARPPLLLADQSRGQMPQPGQLMNEFDIARLKDRARENIEIRAEYVREVAKRKQDVLMELVTLAETVDLTPRDPAISAHTLYLVQPDERNTVVAKFLLDAATGNSKPADDFTPTTVEKLAMAITGSNAIAVICNAEITEPLLELGYVSQTICDEWEKRHPAPQPSTPIPA